MINCDVAIFSSNAEHRKNALLDPPPVAGGGAGTAGGEASGRYPGASVFIGGLENNMPKTILIVEDNVTHADLIKDVLGTKGFKTVHAARGSEARSLAREFRPSLVIMDIQLPDISGMEVTKIF